MNAQKIIIKIGTNVVTDSSGRLDLSIIKRIAKQVAELKKSGKKIILVTSGAIGAGVGELKLKSSPSNILMRQVCASIGQGIIMSKYHSAFSHYGIKVAQVLVTYDTFKNKKMLQNMRNSINKLLELGAVPIFNENDTISIEEIGKFFGDNDLMSAMLATKINADLLILLTNVDGLYNKNPKNKTASLIKEVRLMDSNLAKLSGKSVLGIGGMKTKLEASKIATKSGTKVVIANGRKSKILTKILSNEPVGTTFYPRS